MKKIAFCMALLLLCFSFAGCKRELTEAEIARYEQVDKLLAEPREKGELIVSFKEGVTLEQAREDFADAGYDVDFDNAEQCIFRSDKIRLQITAENGENVPTAPEELWVCLSVPEEEIREVLYTVLSSDAVQDARPGIEVSEEGREALTKTYDPTKMNRFGSQEELEAYAHRTVLSDLAEEYREKEYLIVRFRDQSLMEIWEFFVKAGFSKNLADTAVYEEIHDTPSANSYTILLHVSEEEIAEQYEFLYLSVDLAIPLNEGIRFLLS